MINPTDITGLLSGTIAIAAVVVRLSGAECLRKTYFVLLLCAIVVAVLIPFGGLPLAAYVRGVTGDLSVTSLVLLSLVIIRPLFGWPAIDTRTKTALLILIVVAAMGLYPMALGMGLFDPYRLGYGNPWLLGGLLLLALIACFRRLPVIALAIALAVFAWGVGWYESSNLWDYLLDPLLAIYAIGALLKQGMLALLKPRQG